MICSAGDADRHVRLQVQERGTARWGHRTISHPPAVEVSWPCLPRWVQACQSPAHARPLSTGEWCTPRVSKAAHRVTRAAAGSAHQAPNDFDRRLVASITPRTHKHCQKQCDLRSSRQGISGAANFWRHTKAHSVK